MMPNVQIEGQAVSVPLESWVSSLHIFHEHT